MVFSYLLKNMVSHFVKFVKNTGFFVLNMREC